jgi:hypothetical protein
VGPTAGLDTEVRGKIPCPCRGSKIDREISEAGKVAISPNIFVVFRSFDILSSQGKEITGGDDDSLLDIASCSLVAVDGRFRGAYCLNHQSDE